MITEEEKSRKSSGTFDPKKSIKRAGRRKANGHSWKIALGDEEYSWSTRMDRVALIREGVPYEAIEVLSAEAGLPVKRVLGALGLPQTTYNKKKRDSDLLNPRDSEVVLVLIELISFGIEVFNSEKEKFHRWLKKPNLSLGGAIPVSLFDSMTGIQEVRNSLNRLEYGNPA